MAEVLSKSGRKGVFSRPRVQKGADAPYMVVFFQTDLTLSAAVDLG